MIPKYIKTHHNKSTEKEKYSKPEIYTAQRRIMSRSTSRLPLFPFLLLLVFLIGVLLIRQGQHDCSFDKIASRTIQKWSNIIPDDLPDNLNERLGSEDEENQCKYEDYVFGQPVSQTDPCLISTIKKKLLRPPPPPEEVNREPVNVTNELPSNLEKFNFIQKLLIDNRNPPRGTPGFFIECGANDGEFISSTLRIERVFNWTGLLVEGNPIPYNHLIKMKRNAWSINAAACITPHPEPVTFYTNPRNTGISGLWEKERHGVTVNITVPCVPLYTMLAALKVKTVDFFNLDVEGLELAVLKTIPFDKVKFKVLAIEYAHIPGMQQALNDFLIPKGYRFIKEIQDYLTLDCLYVHESLYGYARTIRI